MAAAFFDLDRTLIAVGVDLSFGVETGEPG